MNRIKNLVDACPDDSSVTLPVATLRLWLGEDLKEGAGHADEVDLTVEQVAEMYGRSPVTIRMWCAAGHFPQAYKLLGKEWRIPRAALAAMRESVSEKRTSAPAMPDLGAWRSIVKNRARK